MSGAIGIDDALVARLRADEILAPVVFEGELRNADGKRMRADQTPEFYVVVYSNRGPARPDRFTGPARKRTKTFWIHSVARSKRQAESVAERVLAQVLNARLIVPGWQCDPVTQPASQPVDVDDSVLPVRYFAADQFDVLATPTTT